MACSSDDPKDLERRIFVGGLPTSEMEKNDLFDLFKEYGKIVGVSMFRGFGFVQFQHVDEAEAAKAGKNGREYKGKRLGVNLAWEGRQAKPSLIKRSPPRPRDSRARSRSPHGREAREPRDSREGREPRPGGHPRDHDARYRGSESREKDPRPDLRDPAYRDKYDRYSRNGSSVEDYYQKKDDPYRDPYRDPGNGRREPEAPDDRSRPEERRRNELYQQYYEALQRRYEADHAVDCSVIVVNKAQNREYAETIGRKVRDLGMVVDLIFLNTEVSLTQALEDVSRALTPFAIIITQQHQMHRSCTVNILFGTPQEHRNMPMQDAMMLVAHNYDTYKFEHRDKEREEFVVKAAKMADHVLLREPDRERHPISLLTTITLLSESKFVSPEELDRLVAYLKDKRTRLDPHSAAVSSAASHLEGQPPSAVLPPPSRSAHAPPQSSHAPPVSNAPPNPSHQQELQAKILSLFNSGAGAPPSAGSSQSQGYGSIGQHQPALPVAPRPSMPQTGPPPLGYGMPAAPGGQRPPSSASGINFDNPSVQKALDTLIQAPPMYPGHY